MGNYFHQVSPNCTGRMELFTLTLGFLWNCKKNLKTPKCPPGKSFNDPPGMGK